MKKDNNNLQIQTKVKNYFPIKSVFLEKKKKNLT